MSEEYKVFLLNKIPLIYFMIVMGSIFLINAYAVYVYGGLLFWSTLPLLGYIFFTVIRFITVSFTIIVSGDEICIVAFDSIFKLNFSKHLCEILERNGQIISYRFKYNGVNFQISPHNYIETQELQNYFTRLIKTSKVIVPVVRV